MRCRSCQFDNPAGMRFCGQCGAALQPSAPVVPAPAAAPPTPAWAASVQAYTPRHLADKILRSRSALEGERRHELRRALQQWPRAQTVHDTLHRLRVSA